MSERKNYYEILNITPEEKKLTGDKFKEICRKKYRALSLKWHPDKFATASEEERKAAEEKFKDISEANTVLSDPDKRRQYDNGNFEFNPNDFGGFNVNDIFGNMGGWPFGFGRQQQPRGPQKGRDIQTVLVLSVEDAYNGGEKSINVTKDTVCDHCHGTGSEDGQEHICPNCNGTGMFMNKEQRGNTTFITQSPCSKCGGSGHIIDHFCHKCHGSGRLTKTESVIANVPKGVSDGVAFTVKGKGEPSPNGGPNGDLRVHVQISQNENDYFVIDNARNIIHIEEIPFNLALCGFKKKVRCLDGTEVEINAPELTRDNTSFEFERKGMPDPRGNGNIGPYFVIVRHTFPEKLSKKQKDALKNFNK